MNQVSVVPPPDPDEHAAKPGAIRAAVARKATALVLNLIVLLTNRKVLSALKLRVLATLEEIQVMWGKIQILARPLVLGFWITLETTNAPPGDAPPRRGAEKLPGLDSNQ